MDDYSPENDQVRDDKPSFSWRKLLLEGLFGFWGYAKSIMVGVVAIAVLFLASVGLDRGFINSPRKSEGTYSQRVPDETPPGQPVRAQSPDTEAPRPDASLAPPRSTLSIKQLHEPIDGYRLPSLLGQFANNQDIGYYAESATYHSSRVWAEYLADSQFRRVYAQVVLVGPGLIWKSACTKSGGKEYDMDESYPYVMFCADDSDYNIQGLVWLPQKTLAKVWDSSFLGVKKPYRAAFASGAVGVYAYSLFVQSQLQELAAQPALNPAARRLVATCFTGAWAHLAHGNNITSGDADAAVAAMGLLGNAEPVKADAAVQAAFAAGHKSGRPMDCIKAYWPGAIV